MWLFSVVIIIIIIVATIIIWITFAPSTLPTVNAGGHYMYHQFNTQQLYVQPTQLYLCVLCGSENKQPLFPYTALRKPKSTGAKESLSANRTPNSASQ